MQLSDVPRSRSRGKVAISPASFDPSSGEKLEQRRQPTPGQRPSKTSECSPCLSEKLTCVNMDEHQDARAVEMSSLRGQGSSRTIVSAENGWRGCCPRARPAESV